MPSYEIDVRARSRAPRDAVWAVVANARDWSRWGRWQRAVLEREGSPPPDGVGALRRFTRWPVVSREEVVAFEPPERLGYELRSGLPVRDYRAEIELTDGERTEIRWRCRFEAPSGIGGLIRRTLDGFIADAAERLAREAERRADGAGGE